MSFMDWAYDLVVSVAVAAVIGALLLIPILWWLFRLWRRLAARPCPHCGRLLGRASVRRAKRTRVAMRESERSYCGDIDTGEHEVPCQWCGAISYFYMHTEALSATDSPLRGIPESSTPLPDFPREISEPANPQDGSGGAV